MLIQGINRWEELKSIVFIVALKINLITKLLNGKMSNSYYTVSKFKLNLIHCSSGVLRLGSKKAHVQKLGSLLQYLYHHKPTAYMKFCLG